MPAAQQAALQVQLLVWIFVMRLIMVITSALSYFISEASPRADIATSGP